MSTIRLPLTGPTYSTRSITGSTDRAINVYPEQRELPGDHPWVLIETPGLLRKTMLQPGPVRGLYAFQGRVFAADKDTVYELFIDPAANISAYPLGPIQAGPDAVTFADNGKQVCLVSNTKAYILSEAEQDSSVTSMVLQEIDQPDALPNGLSQVQFLDGYFVGLEPNSRRIHISNLWNGLIWDPLDFKDRESSSDNVVAIIEDHGEILLLGDLKSEFWYNSGNADFPLDRIPNARMELGCAAPQSVAKMDNAIFWLGNDQRGNRVVWRAQGYQALRVSNHSVEYHLNRFSDVSRAVAWTYQEEGHSFYCLQIPDAPPNTEFTWVYDANTNMWHERMFWDRRNAQMQPHKARCHCFAWNMHLVGDRNNGRIYQQSLDLLDDDGWRIRRIRVLPHLISDMHNVFYQRVLLLLDCNADLKALPTVAQNSNTENNVIPAPPDSPCNPAIVIGAGSIFIPNDTYSEPSFSLNEIGLYYDDTHTQLVPGTLVQLPTHINADTSPGWSFIKLPDAALTVSLWAFQHSVGPDGETWTERRGVPMPNFIPNLEYAGVWPYPLLEAYLFVWWQWGYVPTPNSYSAEYSVVCNPWMRDPTWGILGYQVESLGMYYGAPGTYQQAPYALIPGTLTSKASWDVAIDPSVLPYPSSDLISDRMWCYVGIKFQGIQDIQYYPYGRFAETHPSYYARFVGSIGGSDCFRIWFFAYNGPDDLPPG